MRVSNCLLVAVCLSAALLVFFYVYILCRCYASVRSLYLFVCLFPCVSFCLPLGISTSLYVSLFLSRPLFLSVSLFLSFFLFFFLYASFFFLCVSFFLYLSFFLCVSFFLYLSLFLYLSFFLSFFSFCTLILFIFLASRSEVDLSWNVGGGGDVLKGERNSIFNSADRWILTYLLIQ